MADSLRSLWQTRLNPSPQEEQNRLIALSDRSADNRATSSTYDAKTSLEPYNTNVSCPPPYDGAAEAMVGGTTSKIQGWRRGVSVSALAALAVLIVNLVLTIWASLWFGTYGGMGTAWQGDCDTANNIVLRLHAGINILSTILLTVSTATMQILNAPTRREIDRAHAQGYRMDVGVLSMRNLINIRRPNTVLFLLLAITSAPIHLLYNSTVLQTLDANNYSAMVVTPDFLSGSNFSMRSNTADSYHSIRDIQTTFTKDGAYQDESRFVNLSRHDCIAAYKTSFVSGRSNVLVVTTENANSSVFYTQDVSVHQQDGETPWSWLCSPLPYYNDLCISTTPNQNATEWTVGGQAVDHCISELVPEACKVQFSLPMLAIVIVCNALKTACTFAAMWRKRGEADHVIATVGDAVASYLEFPDDLTRGRCLMTKHDARRGPLRWRPKGQHEPNLSPVPQECRKQRRRFWFCAAGATRWAATMGVSVIAVLACAGMLVPASQRALSYDYDSKASTISVLWNNGFGVPDLSTLLGFHLSSENDANMMGAVLLANLPQVAMSYLYVLYTELLTCMLLCHEWSTYAVQRKGLRVTTPRRNTAQRSTYFLSLPYRYKIPLILVSVVAHWLVSSSFFYVQVSVYQDGVIQPGSGISDVGFSCAPMICLLFLGSAIILVTVGLGFRRFASSMPVASYCSVAIAAACHPPAGNTDAAYAKVQWGNVTRDETSQDEVRHCSFTSREVGSLQVGRLYA